MEIIETRNGFFAKVLRNNADVYAKNGICIRKNVQVLRLKPDFRPFQVLYQDNILLLGCDGLLGGGNCSSNTRNDPPKRTQTKENINKRLSVNSCVSPIELFMNKDDLIENKIKKLLSIFFEKLKVGEYLFSVVKEIEEEKIGSTLNFLSIFEELLQILNLPELYYNKNGVYLRYKLSMLARRFLVLACIVQASEITSSLVQDLKKVIESIKVFQQISLFPEVCFELNLSLIESLVNMSGFPIQPSLRPLVDLMLANYYKGVVDSDLTALFFSTSLNQGRGIITDMLFLELIDPSKSLKLLSHMIDLSSNQSWENIGLILLKLAFGGEETKLLSEYLYFSNFEIKDVWKVRFISLELLIHTSALNYTSVGMISTVIHDKSSQPEESYIKALLENHDFYQYSVNIYQRAQGKNALKDSNHSLPKLPLSQCETSNLSLLLKAPSHKVIAITGNSGTGKTVLALNYAYSSLDFYSFIYFIPSQSDRLVNAKFQQLSKRLKLIIQESLEDMISAVLRNLNKQTTPFLLIFDNAKDLESIQKYLPNAGHVIITSTSTEWKLRYEMFPLEEALVNVYLAEFYSRELSKGLEGNYMAIGLALKMLKNKAISAEALLKKLENSKGLTGIFLVLVDAINEKIEGAKDFLYCLGMIENSLVPRILALEIFALLRVPTYNFDLTIALLSKYGLVEESKGFTVLLHTSFHQFLNAKAERAVFYAGLLKQTYFNLCPDLKFLDTSKKESKISLLINKFSDLLQSSNTIDTGVVFFLKGKYELQIEFNVAQAIKSFKKALLCVKTRQDWTTQLNFALGCSYLRNFKAFKSIPLFINVLENNIDSSYKLLSNAFLVRAYDYIGNSTKIAEIIIHTSDTNFQQLTLPEAVYCTIHGICRLSLNCNDLQELLLPYSSFLYSRAPSIGLIVTLLKLTQTFAAKEKWKTALNYLNLITPLVQVESGSAADSINGILLVLERILIELQGRIELLVGNSHRMISLIHLILGKIYDFLGKLSQEKESLIRACEIRAQSFGKTHIFVGEVYYELGVFSANKEKKLDVGMEYANSAKEIIEKASGEEFLIFAKILELQGMIFMRMGEMEKAKTCLENSFKLKQRILSRATDNEEISIGISNMAQFEYFSNNKKIALKLYGKALNAEHSSRISLKTAKKAVKLCEELQKPDKALKFQQNVINILINTSEDPEKVYKEQAVASEIAMQIKDYEAANKFISKNLEVLKEINREGGCLDESKHLIKLADSFIKLSNESAAEFYMKEALEVSLKSYGAGSSEYINAKNALGVFLNIQNKSIEAISHFTDIINDLSGVKLGKTFKAIGMCYMKLQQPVLAMAEFTKALKIFQENSSFVDIAKLYHMYGHYYKDDKSTAINYLKKALELYKENLGKDNAETMLVAKTLETYEKAIEGQEE